MENHNIIPVDCLGRMEDEGEKKTILKISLPGVISIMKVYKTRIQIFLNNGLSCMMIDSQIKYRAQNLGTAYKDSCYLTGDTFLLSFRNEKLSVLRK